MDDKYILKLHNITKEFPGVRALDCANLNIRRGEIHALCGENGAGKSTLMKILAGVYPHHSFNGEILYNGKKLMLNNTKDAEQAGIRIIYQELMLVNDMTVGENIFLGDEPLAYRFPLLKVIDWRKLYSTADSILKTYGFDMPVREHVRNLGVGQKQMVEMAKALSEKADILILDEPTSALTERETEILMGILADLKSKGVTCIYISHKLDEIMRITDTVTVMRDGRTVGTSATKDLSINDIISMMVGVKMTERFPKKASIRHESKVLEVKGLTSYKPDLPHIKAVNNASFVLKEGEILGIAGLMGSGRTELVMTLIGEYGVKRSGSVNINGSPVKINSARDAIKNGITLVPEDRKNYGLSLLHSILQNVTITNMGAVSRLGVINKRAETKRVGDFCDVLKVKTTSVNMIVETLSGGTQQKVVIAKSLNPNPKILILDEPTRGIDVGAKREIYNIMAQLVEKGVSIIMVSSELPEILEMSDRILVMHEGKIGGIISHEEATQERIMKLATGVA